MTRSEFHCLAPDALLYLWSGKAQHAATSKAIEVLREALGDEADAVLAGAWRLRARVTAARKACKHGSYLELASAARDDVIVVVHLRDVEIETREEHAARVKIAAERFDRAQAQRAKLRLVDTPPASVGPTAPEPARCDPPARTPWADNKRVGAIYVEREPSGTYRVSLVSADGGEKPRQIQSSTGLLADELAGAIDLCARRLAAIAARTTAGGSGEATA